MVSLCFHTRFRIEGNVSAGAGNAVYPILTSNKNPQLSLRAYDYSSHAVKLVQVILLFTLRTFTRTDTICRRTLSTLHRQSGLSRRQSGICLHRSCPLMLHQKVSILSFSSSCSVRSILRSGNVRFRMSTRFVSVRVSSPQTAERYPANPDAQARRSRPVSRLWSI